MDRYWFVTWTTYANWLPGDARGFVSNVPTPFGSSAQQNVPDTPPESDIPWMREYSRGLLVSEPIRLALAQAEAVCDQFEETTAHRGWELLSGGVMANHVHLVVGVGGDPDPDVLLRDFKSYASRRLNRQFGRRERWWTEGGSTRKLPDDVAVHRAVNYVRDRDFPLVIRVYLDDEQVRWRVGDPPLPKSQDEPVG